jgi:CDP-diacylglycerol--glycerol-3-phosphate 3-phosphatidyltransferase
MTLADKVTSLRIIVAPLFFVVYFWFAPPPVLYWLPVLLLWFIFILAELTDMFDGIAARKLGEVSDFGKFFDPFADTLVQLTFFLCFVMDGILPLSLFILVLYREFSILFVRNLMLRKGIAMGARMSGKIKTVTYITTEALALAAASVRRLPPLFGDKTGVFSVLLWVSRGFFVISVLFSLLSFADYVKVYRKTGQQ